MPSQPYSQNIDPDLAQMYNSPTSQYQGVNFKEGFIKQGGGEPLSPVMLKSHTNTSKMNKSDDTMLDSLNQAPKHAGLSTLEYAIDNNSKYYGCSDVQPSQYDARSLQIYKSIFGVPIPGTSDSQSERKIKPNNDTKQFLQKSMNTESNEVYFNDFSKQDDSKNSNIQSQNKQSSNLSMMEIEVILPYQTMVEQIEVKLNQNQKQFGLLNKYLKLAGITKSSILRKEVIKRDEEIGQDIQMTIFKQENDPKEERERLAEKKYLKLQSGYYDTSKKIMQVNVCGSVTNAVTIQFLFNNQAYKDILYKYQEIQTRHKKSNDQDAEYEYNQNLQQQYQGERSGRSQYQSSQDNQQNYSNDSNDIVDIEVQNIASKIQRKRNQNNDRDRTDIDLIKIDDISLQFNPDNQENENKNHSKNSQDIFQKKFAQVSNKKNKSNHNKNQSKTIEYTADEIITIEEFKIFQGNNIISWAQSLLQLVVQSIKIIGFNMNKIPAITNLSHFINISFYLKKYKQHLEDALEVDFLLGTLLISSKRNMQALEILRNKVQKLYIMQIQENMKKLSGKQQNNQNLKDAQNSILSYNDKQNLKIQVKKLFTRAALIELMCSESMCIKPQLNDKLKSLVRMTQLCRGQLVQQMPLSGQIFLSDDEYTTIIKILPFMLKFTIQCIETNSIFNKEIIIVSALRNIQYILETQGCSLDSAMIVILKSIFKNYPDKIKQEKIAKRARDLKEKQLKTSNYDKLNLNNGQQKTLLAEVRRFGGIYGTCSENEIIHKQSKFTDSSKEIQQIPSHFNNLNSARGTGAAEQRKIQESAVYEQMRLISTTQKKFDKVSLIEQIFSLSYIHQRDEPAQKKEPASGFEKTLTILFNSLLETYISVLSSISSHILHQIFYEVIVPSLINQPFDEDKSKYEAMDPEEKQINSEFCGEIKVFAIKIAEKIITICQGDLIMNKNFLDTIIQSQSAPSFKKQSEMNGIGEIYRNQIKNLWVSIRQKVFTNYSMKGFKQLIEWLVSKMSLLAQNCTILDGKSSASEIAMLELQEEDLIQLSQYLEIITLISAGRRNNQEESNSLIKIKQESCMDLYLLMNPLLFWLDFSVEREERLNLFKQVYQTIKDVLENLPPKKVDIDILQIIIPILQRTSEYLRSNSPTQSMLKFLDIVLQDIKVGKYCQTNYPDLQYFFLDQLNSLVDYISFGLFEEIFPVFDKLLYLSQNVISQKVLQKCIMALVDKYTMKNKLHKASIQALMKSMIESKTDEQDLSRLKIKNFFKYGQFQTQVAKTGLNNRDFMEIFDQEIQIPDLQDSMNRRELGGHNRQSQMSNVNEQNNLTGEKQEKTNFFDIMVDYCFFENDDIPAKVAAKVLVNNQNPLSIEDSVIRSDKNLQFRSPNDLHELYIDKLQFFIDCLTIMGQKHINAFYSLIFNTKFKQTIFGLLNLGETNLRLKCHEILEIVGAYFVSFCQQKTQYDICIPQPSQNNSLGSQRITQINDRTRTGGNILIDNSNKNQEIETVQIDFITHDRLYICQIIIQCIRKSLELNNRNDSYLQFNCLILLDYLFQNLLPVPTFQNQIFKDKKNIDSKIIMTSNQHEILQQQQLLQQQQEDNDWNNSDNIIAANESQIEDGSSGGEGTTGRAIAAVAAAAVAAALDGEIDIETITINEQTAQFEIIDRKYTAMRLKLIFKLWPYIQEALNSPWSNIRSICYGLICSMLKIDINDCNKYLPLTPGDLILTDSNQQVEIKIGRLDQKEGRNQSLENKSKQEQIIKKVQEKDKELLETNKFYVKMRQIVIPMMINLLSSKESESKAGGLNILGSICGLSYDFSKVKISKNLNFFKRNFEFISLPIWQLVFELQDDWDITIKEASIVLIQLCAPREAINYFNKCKVDKENQKFQQMLNKMAKNGGGQGGYGSMSNLSSARQNSLNQFNSKSSLAGLKKSMNENAGDQSHRRIDYKNVDFGYKNKAIPNIPGLLNEFGKLDIANFLNDNQDMMMQTAWAESSQINQNQHFNKDTNQVGSSYLQQQQNIQRNQEKLQVIGDNLVLDLDRVAQLKEQTTKKNETNHNLIGFDFEAAFQQSSLSQRSNFFGGNEYLISQNYQQNQLNQQILMHSQQYNQNLAQAMQGLSQKPASSNFGNNQSSQFNIFAQFDFFVDEYTDEQIQEIISIFRNDFKPPKNLWIEKAAESSVFNGPDIYSEIYSQAIEQFNQQQLILQQKQQQELQDQVSSSGSNNSSPREPLNNQVVQLGTQSASLRTDEANQRTKNPEAQSLNNQKAEQSQYQIDNFENDQKQMQTTFDRKDSQKNNLKHQIADATSENNSAQRQFEDTTEEQQTKKESQSSNNIQHNRKQDLQFQDSQKQVKNENEKMEMSQKLLIQQLGNKQFDPKTDLNIFEQINFDDMNINMEDINQKNQKQEIINSSNSDIGDQGGDASIDYQNSNGAQEQFQNQKMKQNNQLKQSYSNYNARDASIKEQKIQNNEDPIDQDDKIDEQDSQQYYEQEESANSSYNNIQNKNKESQFIFDKSEQNIQQKYKGGGMGTELQIIESISNELSSQQTSQKSNIQYNVAGDMQFDIEEYGNLRPQYNQSDYYQDSINKNHSDLKYQQYQQQIGALLNQKKQNCQKSKGDDKNISIIDDQDGCNEKNLNIDEILDQYEQKNSKAVAMILQDKKNNLIKQGAPNQNQLNNQLQQNQKMKQNFGSTYVQQQQLVQNNEQQNKIITFKSGKQTEKEVLRKDQNAKILFFGGQQQAQLSKNSNYKQQNQQAKSSNYQDYNKAPNQNISIKQQNYSQIPTVQDTELSMAPKSQSFDIKTQKSENQKDQQQINQNKLKQLNSNLALQDNFKLSQNELEILAELQLQQNKEEIQNEKKSYNVNTSCSMPDFKNQIQKTLKNQPNLKYKNKRNNEDQASGQQITDINHKNSNEIESARLNFSKGLQFQQVIGQNNFGNFSHRVQGANFPIGAAIKVQKNVNYNVDNFNINSVSGSTQIDSKNQILKKIKQIKTNNEDYLIMQNISNQMGGQVTGPLYNLNMMTEGLNTTKNRKIEKSLEDLIQVFQNEKQFNICTQRFNSNSQKQQQSQDFQNQFLQNKNQNQKNTKNINKLKQQQGENINRKKTTSSSPQKTSHEITKLLMNNVLMNQSNGNKTQQFDAKNIGMSQKSKQQQHKMSINTTGQGVQRAQQKSLNIGINQNNLSGSVAGGQGGTGGANSKISGVSSNKQKNSRSKKSEKMKDLNYFIKTIEKYSSRKVNDIIPQVFNQKLQVINNETGGRNNQINTLSSDDYASVHDPQTPKDVLLNINDQLQKLYRTGHTQKENNFNSKLLNTKILKQKNNNNLNFQNDNEESGRVKNSKSIQNIMAIQNSQQPLGQKKINEQQMQMKNFNQQKKTIENLHKKIKIDGLNLAQLNKILSQDLMQQSSCQNNSRIRGRSETRAMIDLTPDNKNKDKFQYINKNAISKSSKSTNSNIRAGSYSPQNREYMKLQAYLVNQLQEKNQNKPNKKQVQIDQGRPVSIGLISADSNARNKGANKSQNTDGRSTSGHVSKSRKVNNQIKDQNYIQKQQMTKKIDILNMKKGKKLSCKFNASQLQNMANNFSYSQTQKLDIKEINKQLMQGGTNIFVQNQPPQNKNKSVQRFQSTHNPNDFKQLTNQPQFKQFRKTSGDSAKSIQAATGGCINSVNQQNVIKPKIMNDFAGGVNNYNVVNTGAEKGVRKQDYQQQVKFHK